MNITKPFSVLLCSLVFNFPASATELDITRNGNSEVNICNRETRQCSTVALPSSTGPVRQLLQGKFVRHAKASWITISRKKAHVCAMQTETDSQAICLQVAADVSRIKVESGPHQSGGTRWVFTPKAADVAAEEIGYQFITAVEKADTYFTKLGKSGGASHRSLMQLSTRAICLPQDGSDNADTACGGSDDDDDRDNDNHGGNDNESGEGLGGGNDAIVVILPPTVPPVVIIRPPAPSQPQDPTIPVDRPKPPINSCSLFGIGCNDAKDSPRPAAECQAVYRNCQQTCVRIYTDNPDWLPGSGSDYKSRMRVCIRQCMSSGGCENY